MRQRQRHLDKLGRDVDTAWVKLEKLIESDGSTKAAKSAQQILDGLK